MMSLSIPLSGLCTVIHQGIVSTVGSDGGEFPLGVVCLFSSCLNLFPTRKKEILPLQQQQGCSLRCIGIDDGRVLNSDLFLHFFRGARNRSLGPRQQNPNFPLPLESYLGSHARSFPIYIPRLFVPYSVNRQLTEEKLSL